jgi:hypothetical protein
VDGDKTNEPGEREREAHDELVAVMGRLAAGDEAAVVTLYERFGAAMAPMVQAVARSRRGPFGRDDLAGVVFEVCEEIARIAGGWSPDGGALPWVWARHRVVNVVDRMLGQWAVPLDDVPEVAERAAPSEPAEVAIVVGAMAVDESFVTTLDRLQPRHEGARLLAEALEHERISPRDRELLLEYGYEQHSGNRSPATTVAPGFGMTEVAVRQAARRSRERIRMLAASDERFAPLATLPLLA